MKNLLATELRIGNYVYNEFTRKEMQVYPIMIHQLSKIGSTNIKPIKLTEDWLINLGSFKFDNQFIFDRFRITYRPDYKFYYILCKETNTYITKVEFVHEWQNVVFALNGKELTL